MIFRFHILGIPHAASNKQWLCCAYTQKVIKLCAMLKALGHHVIHYGNAASEVDANEHVTVTAAGSLGPPSDYMSWDMNGPIYNEFNGNAIAAINRRKQSHDFLLCMWGSGHRQVAEAHKDLIIIEPGIGYAGGHFAPFKVFESYAILHAYYGTNPVGTANQLKWYDVVIQNYFDPHDFTFKIDKQDYLLFLGRVYSGKGIHIAREIAQATGRRLVVAGPISAGESLDCNGIEYAGIVGNERRRELLANARALIAPSTFLEPFCGTVTEAHFSGTPTITADWGAFAENNLNGVTGYRCRTFEEFCWAVTNIDRVDSYACREWAMANFTTARVGAMYQEYFQTVMNIYTGNGWYEPNPARVDLDRTTRFYPGGSYTNELDQSRCHPSSRLPRARRLSGVAS
jgi:Glycosyl transferases group 1